MAESIAFVTDARLAKVIGVLDAAGECLNLNPDDDSLRLIDSALRVVLM